MRIKERKITIVLLMMFFLLVVFAMFPMFKGSKMNIAYAQENMQNANNPLSPKELVVAIENDLNSQGKSIVSVLHNQRDFYENEFNTANIENKDVILAKLNTVEQAIEDVSLYMSYLSNDNDMATRLSTTASQYPYHVAPDCTCGTLEYIAGTPCANCIIYTDTSTAVTAVAVGFEARGWSLAADLLWFNMSNTTPNIEYWPTLGTSIAEAPQIANKLAQENVLAWSFNQDDPGYLNGIFASTIEGDTYNSLGSFYYSKTPAEHGMIDVSIQDLYDWEYKEDGGSGNVFNNTMYSAQEMGILIPFYTRINLNIPGYAPFDWVYTDEGVVITGVADDITNVNIPTVIKDMRVHLEQLPDVNISSVGANAFANKAQITSITIPNTVTSVGNGAFNGCTNLTSLSLPDAITSIGANAFSGCTSLTSINIPANVTSIGAGAFAGCSSLTNITIPAGVTYIGEGAFAGCSNLNISVNTGNPNYSAQGNILYNKAKTKIIGSGDIAANITLLDSVTEVGASAFSGNTNLQRVDIYGTPVIDDLAFYNCANLNEVYFYSYMVPEIGSGAFADNEFTLYVPHSKQSQYVTAFAGYVNTASSIPVTISFSSDGAVIDTVNTYFGANITEITNPSKTGYNFVGWYDNTAYTGMTYTNGGLWDTTSNMTVYAKWSPQTYYIYFNGYGSENLTDKEVTYDALIGTMPSVSRTGYTFYGWKNQYNEYFTSDMIWQKLSNQTVSPDLRANQYTITYNGNGGTANVQSQSVCYDSVISSFATAYRDGYTFTGWNTKANGSGQAFNAPYTYIIDDDTTLYAQYTANEYNVSFDKQGGSGGSDGVSATYNMAMPSGTSITAPSKIGYSFQGYYRYANGVGTKYYNADMTSANFWDLLDDTTLFAYWSANQYTVTLNQQNGSGGTNSVNATYNTAMPSGVNITAPIRVGYSFQGYFQYVNGGGIQYYNSDMTSHSAWNVAGNSTIYAYWTPNVYNVVLQKESGTGGSDSVNVTYLCNMPSAIAPTRVGYTFQGYYSLSNGSGTKYYNADMSSAHLWDVTGDGTLYAYWTGDTYTVTFDKQGGSGGTNAVVATYGSDMPTAGVSAPTRQGYVFKGYYESTNANGIKYYDGPNLTSVHTWDKTSDTTLYAYWEQEEYTITFILYDGMTDSTTLHYGDHVQADYAPYKQHYEFKGYYSGQNGTGICYVRGVLTQKNSDFFTIEPESTSYTWNTYGNGTLYGYWELLVTDYSYQIVAEGEGYLPNRTIRIVSGSNTVLNAPSIDGYTFKEWNVNGFTRTNGSSYSFELHRSYITGEITIHYYFGGSAAYSDGYLYAVYTKNPSCVAAGTMITLADGTQKRVELLTGNEMLLVWNMYTGQFDSAPILFIDHDPYALYKIIKLHFSDGTIVKVIDEHAFWDFNLNKYVFLREDAAQYVGHWFNKQTTDANGNMIWTRVQLTNVTITEEYTTAWSPVTYGHLCIYVNGMLSMPGATEGLINIFEVDGDIMQINQEHYLADIATYGLFTYEEFAEIYPVSETIFEAFGGEYLKVSIGKGLIDYETIGKLIERYSVYFE